MVLGGRPPGRVGRRQNFLMKGLAGPIHHLVGVVGSAGSFDFMIYLIAPMWPFR